MRLVIAPVTAMPLAYLSTPGQPAAMDDGDAACWERCVPCCSLIRPIAAIFWRRSPKATELPAVRKCGIGALLREATDTYVHCAATAAAASGLRSLKNAAAAAT